jgi:hypothetical protein
MQRVGRIPVRARIKDDEYDGWRTNKSLKDTQALLNLTLHAFISVGLFSAGARVFSTVVRAGRRRPAAVFAAIVSQIELAIFNRGDQLRVKE